MKRKSKKDRCKTTDIPEMGNMSCSQDSDGTGTSNNSLERSGAKEESPNK